jgi:transposase
MQDISQMGKVSIGVISKVICNYCKYGAVNNPYSHQTGCPSYLNPGDLEFLEAVITANPSFYLDGIQQKLAAMQDVHVSIATVSQALVSLNLTHKVITKVAAEHDEQLWTV